MDVAEDTVLVFARFHLLGSLISPIAERLIDELSGL